MAARARSRRRRARRGTATIWSIALVAVALAAGVGAWVWWQPLAGRATAPASASQKAPAGKQAKKPRPAPTPSEDPDRFEFYDMLADQEVAVAGNGARAPGAPPPPLRGPGIYVVQAGSFPNFPEADAVKARLALLGIESQIQTISVDGRTFHRVRIGPIEDPVALNRLRARLAANKLEYLVMQVTE